MSKQNPYLNARREWDERYGGLISRARNWQQMWVCPVRHQDSSSAAG